jgi:hypothetical protein
MRGTLQFLIWFLIAGGSAGFCIKTFREQHWIILVPAVLFLLVSIFHIAEAVWLPTWGQGRDWIDRIGILVRGIGFAGIAFAAFMAPGAISLVVAVIGLLAIMFGRALWELAVLPKTRNQ